MLDIIQAIAHCNTVSSICIFPWLNNPYISKSLLLSLILLQIIVILQKPVILWIFDSPFDVESQRQKVKRVVPFQLEIPLQVVVKSLFVANVKIRLEMVVYLQRMRTVYSADPLLFIHLYSPLVCIFSDPLFSFFVLL